MVQKRNRAKRKYHTCFFVFHLVKMKFEPIDSELNPASGNQPHFYLKTWLWYLEKLRNFKKRFEI